jgi:EGF-like domain
VLAGTCARGDNPTSTGQERRAIKLTIANPTTDLSGKVTLNFHGSSKPFDAVSTYMSGLSCGHQVALLDHIKEASCWKVTSLPHFGAQYVIRVDQFFAWSSNNLFTTDGNPPISDFTCDIADVPVGTTCTLTDVDLSMEASGFADLGPSVTYVVTIADATNDPNTVYWKTTDPGALYSSPVAIDTPFNITGTSITLAFASAVGHTAGATWYVHADGVSTTVTVQSSPTIVEHDPCSGRGVCQETSGRCTCFSGFYGSTCEHIAVMELWTPLTLAFRWKNAAKCSRRRL